jgi:hypothetical protein
MVEQIVQHLRFCTGYCKTEDGKLHLIEAINLIERTYGAMSSGPSNSGSLEGNIAFIVRHVNRLRDNSEGHYAKLWFDVGVLLSRCAQDESEHKHLARQPLNYPERKSWRQRIMQICKRVWRK